MSHGDFVMLVGTIVGGAVLLLALIVGVFAAFYFVDARFHGMGRLHEELARRGFARGLIDVVIEDAMKHAPGIAVPLAILLVGLGVLAAGVYELRTMFAPEPEELLLYPAPGVVVTIFGLVVVARALRSRRVPSTPLHRALVSEPARTRLLVHTHLRLWVDDTTLGEALTRTRASVQRDVPHVVLVDDAGEEIAIRCDHDPTLPAAIARVLPHARGVRVIAWRAGLGRTLLTTPVEALSAA